MVSIYRGVAAVARHDAPANKKHHCWFTEVDEVDGREYAQIKLSDPRFTKFVGNKLAMHDILMKKRNAAIDTALKAKFNTAAYGYLGYQPQGGALRLPKRKREEMTDMLPNVLTAVVQTTEGHEYDVRCLVVSAPRHVLSIELTNENMELLQEDPKPDTDSEDGAPRPFRPKITHANVKWNAARSSVYCTYFDAEKAKESKKSFGVVPRTITCPVEFQSKVDSMAKVAADFYALNHRQTPAISNDVSAETHGVLQQSDVDH